ncbi:MAG: hypothetical protein IKM72_16785, partial [Oscillospiraceae bacterium]|nr:hypothetical protein [Oscillospiraceae bacterium]
EDYPQKSAPQKGGNTSKKNAGGRKPDKTDNRKHSGKPAGSKHTPPSQNRNGNKNSGRRGH